MYRVPYHHNDCVAFAPDTHKDERAERREGSAGLSLMTTLTLVGSVHP